MSIIALALFSSNLLKIDMSGQRRVVTVIGSGLIGQSWAMIFAASEDVEVRLYDADHEQLGRAKKEIDAQIDQMQTQGHLRGPRPSIDQKSNIVPVSSLQLALASTTYVQENIPERLELKKRLWAEIDDILSKNQTEREVDEKLILASSTSTLLPSHISEELRLKQHFIVAHPVNPPYFLPMVELVPAEWTSELVRAEAKRFMESLGQVPVPLRRELPGFLLNRLQYVLLNECWRLVASGAVDPLDLDQVMTEGLGMRYAVIGPMQAIHLNAEGTRSYVNRYGPIIHSISSEIESGTPNAWLNASADEKTEVDRVCRLMESNFPLDKLEELRRRRDHKLATLAALKRNLD